MSYTRLTPTVEIGTVTVSCTANATVDKAVTFTKQFAAAPIVILTWGAVTSSGANLKDSTLQVFNRTASGFTVRAYHTATGNVVVNWLAVSPV